MPISKDDFRDALRLYPSGVTIITVAAGGQTHGLTASAFASVSAEPPLISIFVNHKGHAHTLFEQSDAVFAVNLLHTGHQDLANRFAFSQKDRFAEGNWKTAVTGAPILADAIAWLDCTVYSRISAGSHSVYIGEVQATGSPIADGDPLLYWNRDYRSMNINKTDKEKVTE